MGDRKFEEKLFDLFKWLFMFILCLELDKFAKNLKIRVGRSLMKELELVV